MLDVIFNGSSARRPANLAEVTLVFDNASGRLQPNLPDGQDINGLIAITRRLYRSGQSEYLINKTPTRLKHIREMFMGLLNSWFLEQCPDIKPTAGFYTDGHRFLKDVKGYNLPVELVPEHYLVRER